MIQTDLRVYAIEAGLIPMSVQIDQAWTEVTAGEVANIRASRDIEARAETGDPVALDSYVRDSVPALRGVDNMRVAQQ
jgi:hypothetical protein